MKLYRLKDGPWVVESEGQLRELLSPWLTTGTAAMELGEAVAPPLELAAPVEPTKIVCIGLNFVKHAEEQGKPIPEEPLFFMKPTSAILPPGGTIRLPEQSSLVHHEGELAVIIGKRLTRATEADVAEAIFGYTCANDVTARDLQRKDKRYTRAKGFDTFCPLGPCVVLAKDFVPAEHRVEVRLNGDVRQHSALDDFIFDLPRAIAHISHVMSLLPGDVVLTGTPSGVGPMEAGDTVEIDIDGIGCLSNRVG